MALGGPLLQTAVFCETVIEGKDGPISIIRIIDRLTVEASGPDAPDNMPPVQGRMTAVLTFKSGSAKGRSQLRFEMEKPNTDRKVIWTGSMHAEAPDRGQNFVIRFLEVLDLEGLYWFHVFVEDEQVTSIPFRLLYVRQSAGSLPQQKS
jgi:hypothetical protein